jgi:tetratricopeptide (TPR) repeat protein/flagellar biosynthesis regulator FlaF
MPVADFAEADAAQHFRLARRLEAEGRVADAAQEWVAGLQIDPRSESAHLSLADALLELKLYQPASIACRQALMVAPQSAGAYDRLGRAMEGLGDRAGAIEQYWQSVSLGRDRAVSHRLAAALRAHGELESARGVLRDLCDAEPRDAGSRFLLAGVLAELGFSEEAMRHLRKAIAHQPKFPEALNNLALLERAAGETQEAERHFRKAVAMRPEYAAAWNNLGNLAVELSRIEEAAGCYARAITIDPEYAEAHTNRALLSLLRGNFEDGWQEFEWRWRQPGAGIPALAMPEWDGSEIEGKTILLHAEQGAGDTIQFVRYARLLRERGATVLLHCQESLRTLLEGMPELERVFSGPIAAPAFDVHAPLMSLPRLFGTRLESIPGPASYLKALRETAVPDELKSCDKFQVGLVWAGNPNHRNDRNRSIALELVADIVQVEGAAFFSLQVGRTPPDSVVDLAPYLSDFAATAACLAELDLLITVDTSVAHLAGALGRPVWMLLPACNDWRWLEDREDSPWYPTMRLFRQKRLRDWKSVTDMVVRELRSEIKMQTKIYEEMQREGLEGRELEASVLFRAAQKLKRCVPDWERRNEKEFRAKLMNALEFNQNVWSFLQVELDDPSNPLPLSLRLNLLRLSRFVDKQIFSLFAGEGSADDLLSIARIDEQIARGLQAGARPLTASQKEVGVSAMRLVDMAG